MKNRSKQRVNRKRNERIGYHNAERYADPTAFLALTRIVKKRSGRN